MRRGWAIGATLLVVLLTVGIAVGAYNAGIDDGVRRAADSSQVITVVGDRYGHGFLLIGKAFRGSRGPWGHDHGSGYGPWSEEGRARFEDKAGDWHRRQHEQASGGQETTGPPTG